MTQESIRQLLERLNNLGFWDRLFSWGRIKRLVLQATAELQALTGEVLRLQSEATRKESSFASERNALKDSNVQLTTRNEELQQENARLKERNEAFLKRGNELTGEVAGLRTRVEELRDQLARKEKEEEFRKQEHSSAVQNLITLRESIENDRKLEQEGRQRSEILRLKKLKDTWSDHEQNVQNRIKTICSKYVIEYVDKVPFRGEPDNTIRIGDEFIVFDAKSPAGDDLSNFPQYLKTQAESAKKYAKEENVKREIFLVVPTNTLEVLDHFVFRLADYNVFVISYDSLEPVILSLKKIEEYEFAEQLTPEERENICRVIGKFIHLSKRRIQIDGFFTKQFFELVYRSEADLPKEIMEKVVEFEKAEKINPPVERRAKQISLRELESDSESLHREATSKGIDTRESELVKGLNKLPLYSAEPAPPEGQGTLFAGDPSRKP
jgi:hypothetical protein